jgi:hypothetical protein
MNAFKNKKENAASAKARERLAGLIVTRIINGQRQSAHFLNNWFNACSIRRKKWILISFSLLISTLLLTGTFYPYCPIPQVVRVGYRTGHIGMASDLLKPPSGKRQLTDSLTIKIKSWKEH